VTLLKIAPEKNRKVYASIKNLKPPEGVELAFTCGLFGRVDAILVYEASDEKVAMDFLLDVCKMDGIMDTETFTAYRL